MRLPENPPKKELENLLPLVNVVFLLLIFFMVAGAFSSPDPFKITPAIAENDNIAESKVLTILMSDHGELAIDNDVVSIEELLFIIRDALKSQTLVKVQLKPDANADAIHVVELLEHLNKTDLNAIHVMTSAP